jgi:CYTH domain-containing protein
MSGNDPGYPSTEIERKYLVARLPESAAMSDPVAIDQGYIVITSDGMEVRLRRKGKRFFQTVKSGSGLKRHESEIELSEQQFDALWPLTDGRRVEKKRHEIPYGSLTVELDIFCGELKGLIVAEVEFAREENSKAFTPPPWFGREVTGDPRYLNQTLAVKGRPLEDV